MRHATLQFSLALLGACLVTVPSEVQAYCILPNLPTYPQGPFAQFKAVPVYSVALSGLNIGTGFDTEEIGALKIALNIINSAGTNAPLLYYAGNVAQYYHWSSIGYSPEQNETGGILVQTDNCDKQPDWDTPNDPALAAEKHGALKAKIVLRRGEDCGNPTKWYLDPDDDGGSYNDTDNRIDVVGVMTHELLHALGLGHNNDLSKLSNCANAATKSIAVNSFMYIGNEPSRLWRRRLKRDDIEGLREVWGGAGSRTPRYSQSISGSAPDSASWSPPVDVLTGLQVNTPMSLTDAVRNIDELQLAGFTNSADEVRFLTGTWTDWLGNPAGGTAVPSPIPPNNPVHSWDRVVVARGVPGAQSSLAFSRELFAWVGGVDIGTDEDTNNLEVGIHFRVRKEGVWLSQAGPAGTKYRSLGASYDPRHDVFVLAYLDTCMLQPGGYCGVTTGDLPSGSAVFVGTISALTGVTVSTQAITMADDPLAIGDVSCDFLSTTQDTQCKIPIADNATAGPSLRILEGRIGLVNSSPAFILNSTLPLSIKSFGAPSSAMNARLANGSMLVGHTPEFAGVVPAPDGYSRVFTMDRTAAGGLDGGIDNNWTFQTWFWPLHVGTMNKSLVTEPKWRAITY